MIEVRFRCGHALQMADNEPAAPRCPSCGDARIVGVTAPKPRFSGCCAGPMAKTSDLGPARVLLGSPLTLKSHEKD